MRKIFLLLTVTFLLCGCGVEYKEINSLDDLKSARIGAWPDCAYELRAREHFPDAKYIGLDSLSDLVQNLAQHKIDAFVIGKTYAENLRNNMPNVKYLPESLGDVPLSYIFPKTERGQKFRDQMNEFISKTEANGELDTLRQKWLFGDESGRTFSKSNLSGENGKLKIGTDAQSPPFVYLRGQEPAGYEVELIDKFCAAYGYDYEIKVDSFVTMLADVSSGKLDIGADAIEILPERQKSINFANPTYVEQTVAVVSVGASDENFFAALIKRFKVSFVDEDRWQMILEGTAKTLTITIASIIFGTALGFGVYMLYREENKFVNKIIDGVYRTLQGVPTMVMLLFFYYTIFGNLDVPPIVTAVVVFSIVLSISVFILLKNGADAIPRGQTEAALSLGFSERRAFVKFILPQVVRNLFQSYQVALNVTLLETAIVGYISVQDLTRTADLIRARTYDAFVPIIIIAVIYLILSRLLLFVTDRFAEKLNPKNRRREKILDGVKL
ncbi:MAG: transporter substrate-binding domain-containing protein [Selenomonadaceae bacterium]|nr:transporter substrate-binding domain-containing protein [Selenomonadaceae bacterium]